MTRKKHNILVRDALWQFFFCHSHKQLSHHLFVNRKCIMYSTLHKWVKWTNSWSKEKKTKQNKISTRKAELNIRIFTWLLSSSSSSVEYRCSSWLAALVDLNRWREKRVEIDELKGNKRGVLEYWCSWNPGINTDNKGPGCLQEEEVQRSWWKIPMNPTFLFKWWVMVLDFASQTAIL